MSRFGQGATQLACEPTYHTQPGQGATEYLVLLAVVLIVALVSVALLGFFPGMASDAQLTQSKAYWASAQPIAITEWAARYAYDGVGSGYTHFYMRIRNNGVYPIRLSKLLANGRSTTIVYTGDWFPTVNIISVAYLAPGEEKAIGYPNYFPGIPDPGIGNRFFFPLEYEPTTRGSVSSNCSRTQPFGTMVVNDFGFEYIEYIEGQQITKQQIGAKPVTIKCMNNYD